jgi:ParB/RepB/Spo0J family partition protein
MDDHIPITMIPIEQIDSDEKPWHSCRYFLDRDIVLLASAIEHRGGEIDQPMGVRPKADTDLYEVVYGRRRLLAAMRCGLKVMPVRIYNGLTDEEAALRSLSENLCRRDPGILERGWNFARLEDQGLSRKEISVRVGKKSTTLSVGIRFARAIPESLVLQVASELVGGRDPRPIVARVTHLSQRALGALSDAATQGDEGPLRDAIAAVNDGKKPSEVAKIVRNSTRKPRSNQRSAKRFVVSSTEGQRVALNLNVAPTDLAPEEARQLLLHVAPLVKALEACGDELARGPGNIPMAASPRRSSVGFFVLTWRVIVVGLERFRNWVANGWSGSGSPSGHPEDHQS